MTPEDQDIEAAKQDAAPHDALDAELIKELPLLRLYNGNDPLYVQRKLEQAADRLTALAAENTSANIVIRQLNATIDGEKQISEQHLKRAEQAERRAAVAEAALGEARKLMTIPITGACDIRKDCRYSFERCGRICFECHRTMMDFGD